VGEIVSSCIRWLLGVGGVVFEELYDKACFILTFLLDVGSCFCLCVQK
jgi:hypothetical protein